MCGILGALGAFDQGDFERALATIAHRGPDDQGDYTFDNVRFGHRRLSIQDVSVLGHQPMTTMDGRFTIVFNGEIYNHWELRRNLLRDCEFKSKSDTETLLYAYAKYGTGILNQLNGIFAFGIIDRVKREVVLSRDHFGVKPLYLYKDHKKVLFSSEIKALAQFPIDRTINPLSVANYIHFLYSPQEDTPFRHVSKLLPGHFVKISMDNIHDVRPSKYYEIPFEGKVQLTQEEEIVEQLNDQLHQAVESQLLSDVPVGFFLSGGLDSSLLTALAIRKLKSPGIPCFTVNTSEYDSFDGFASDLPYAQKVAKYLNVKLHIARSNPDISECFDRFIYDLDEPQADPAPFHVHSICKMAREQGIKVLIGGAAGDDVFSGYRRHIALRYNPLFRLLPQQARVLAKLLPSQYPVTRRIEKLIGSAGLSTGERMFSYFTWLKWTSVVDLFHDDFKHHLLQNNPFERFLKLWDNIPSETSNLNKMLYWEMKSFLPDHNLSYTDKMGMSQGVEIRVPYLDKELVDLACKIPPAMKLKKQSTKYVLRKVAERYLPSDVIYRPKTGFGAPVRQWIMHDLSNMVEERLGDENLKNNGLFATDKVQKLVAANKQGKIDASYSIWALMSIDSWIKQFGETKTL